MTAHRRLAHSLEREARETLRQAVPYRESRRRVARELIADFLGGLAILAALGVAILAMGRFLILLADLMPWSAIYIGIVAAGLFALCRSAARGDR